MGLSHVVSAGLGRLTWNRGSPSIDSDSSRPEPDAAYGWVGPSPGGWRCWPNGVPGLARIGQVVARRVQPKCASAIDLSSDRPVGCALVILIQTRSGVIVADRRLAQEHGTYSTLAMKPRVPARSAVILSNCVPFRQGGWRIGRRCHEPVFMQDSSQFRPETPAPRGFHSYARTGQQGNRIGF